MPKIISITGSSGVGKTTISNVMSLVLGQHNSCQISGDDLHLWERGDKNWENVTHLNPKANNLELGKLHLSLLKQGLSISRKKYNHDTGLFSEPIAIDSRDWIIYEGLHALYGDAKDLADLRIYVETSDELKADWKIRRDVNKRGYTKQQVLRTISARKQDETSYIQPQKKYANAIIVFNENNGKIEMSYVCIDEEYEVIMKKVKDFYDTMNGFFELCKKLSLEPSLVQGKGGNVSAKFQDSIIITSSGQNIGDVSWESGFCVCKKSKLSEKDEDSFLQTCRASKLSGYKQPSMELGIHKKTSHKYVAHTHPVHLNSILCSSESKEILQTIFPTLKYDYIRYSNPGLDLFLNFNPENNIVFLENHGLVVSGNDENEVFETTADIDRRCKEWISKNSEPHTGLKQRTFNGNHLFPDSVIFPEEMAYIVEQIFHNIYAAGLSPRFLKEEDVLYVKEMKAEKDRKK